MVLEPANAAVAPQAHHVLDIFHQIELLELFGDSTRGTGRTLVAVVHDLNHP